MTVKLSEKIAGLFCIPVDGAQEKMFFTLYADGTPGPFYTRAELIKIIEDFFEQDGVDNEIDDQEWEERVRQLVS